ncbi:hypothetical protein BDV37DRAFT_89551 [Aspergillus pseudonomiae]|uniref:Uncharacterized protein n=1 Tax=Aspergillus pseudonomiae TaxID=1506151 RepID=A0A5N7DGY1_9EURO|nr:uncharacterized protein BDV37DRAFT_89551 [Aspergillus pseudonomiae]KAE8405554.1 hypothetical protein BDV37DRAFT_89551 [Aspergillus pseudonomiae]
MYIFDVQLSLLIFLLYMIHKLLLRSYTGRRHAERQTRIGRNKNKKKKKGAKRRGNKRNTLEQRLEKVSSRDCRCCARYRLCSSGMQLVFRRFSSNICKFDTSLLQPRTSASSHHIHSPIDAIMAFFSLQDSSPGFDHGCPRLTAEQIRDVRPHTTSRKPFLCPRLRDVTQVLPDYFTAQVHRGSSRRALECDGLAFNIALKF